MLHFICISPYCLGEQVKKNEIGGECSKYGERGGVYRVLVGKPEGKRPLGRSRLTLEDNIEMDLLEVGRGGMDWIELAEDRDRCEYGNEPSGSIKCGEFLD
jgi:hypothetical protein